MGFKKSADVRKHILELCTFPKKCIVDITGGEQLPSDLEFEVVITDLSSRLYSLYSACKNGRDVLINFNSDMRALASRFGASSFIWCVDDRDFVSAAKGTERAARQDAKNSEAYGDDLSLCDGTYCNRDTYMFTLRGSLPDNYDRLLATPVLRRKWFVFIGSLLSSYTKWPSRNRINSITISGFPRCSCGLEQCKLSKANRNVVKTVFVAYTPGVSNTNNTLAASSTTTTTTIDKELNLAARIHGGDYSKLLTSEDFEICGSGASSTAMDTERLQHTFTRHVDRHPQRHSPSIEIGESEGQCFYWLDQLVRTENVKNILVRVNDADGWVCGLMTVPRLYNQRANEIQKSLWVDITSRFSNQKMINVVELWRQISSTVYTLAKVPSSSGFTSRSSSMGSNDGAAASALNNKRKRAHGLLQPVELVLFVATLTSNDYCNGLSHLGPAALFAKMRSWLIPKAAAEVAEPFLRINKATGDMVFNEKMAFDFIIAAYYDTGKVQAALRALKITPGLLGNDDVLGKLRAHCQAELDAKIATARRAGQDTSKTASYCLMMPTGDEIRATVRRACFSIYYYYNLYKKLVIDSLATLDGRSLYGYTANEFTSVVATRPGLRPFVIIGSFPEQSLQKSSSAISVSSCTSVTSVGDDDDDNNNANQSLKNTSDPGRGKLNDDGDDDIDETEIVIAESRPTKRSSLPAVQPKVTDLRRTTSVSPETTTPVMRMLQIATNGGRAIVTTANGPEDIWINNNIGAYSQRPQAFQGGEWGSNFPFVERLFHEMSLSPSASSSSCSSTTI